MVHTTLYLVYGIKVDAYLIAARIGHGAWDNGWEGAASAANPFGSLIGAVTSTYQSVVDGDYPKAAETAVPLAIATGIGIVAGAKFGGKGGAAEAAEVAKVVGAAEAELTGLGASITVPKVKPGSAGGLSAGRRFPGGVRQEAFKEDPTKTCVFCGRGGAGTQVDHAIPRAKGGNSTIENAQLACPHCNASKAAGEFPKSRPDGYEGPWPPSHW